MDAGLDARTLDGGAPLDATVFDSESSVVDAGPSANVAVLDGGSLPDSMARAAGTDAGCTPSGPGKCGGGGPAPCPLDLCVPVTCGDFDCGFAGDGCGGLLDCGACPFSEACVDNLCVWPADAGPCVPATCEGLSFDCGPASDGCGGHLECGTCSDSQFCGGGGPHRCGGSCHTPEGGDPCQITCFSDAGSPVTGLDAGPDE